MFQCYKGIRQRSWLKISHLLFIYCEGENKSERERERRRGGTFVEGRVG